MYFCLKPSLPDALVVRLPHQPTTGQCGTAAHTVPCKCSTATVCCHILPAFMVVSALLVMLVITGSPEHAQDHKQQTQCQPQTPTTHRNYCMCLYTATRSHRQLDSLMIAHSLATAHTHTHNLTLLASLPIYKLQRQSHQLRM